MNTPVITIASVNNEGTEHRRTLKNTQETASIRNRGSQGRIRVNGQPKRRTVSHMAPYWGCRLLNHRKWEHERDQELARRIRVQQPMGESGYRCDGPRCWAGNHDDNGEHQAATGNVEHQAQPDWPITNRKSAEVTGLHSRQIELRLGQTSEIIGRSMRTSSRRTVFWIFPVASKLPLCFGRHIYRSAMTFAVCSSLSAIEPVCRPMLESRMMAMVIPVPVSATREYGESELSVGGLGISACLRGRGTQRIR